MSDERHASSAGKNSLGDRLSSIISQAALKPGSVEPSRVAAPLGSIAVWHTIHLGQEFGPLALAELIQRAISGEIEADDLVKKMDGPWTKANEIAFLQREFLLKESRGEAVNQLGRFHGDWVSQRALVVGGCALLFVGIVVGLWAINKPTNARNSEMGAKKQPDPIVIPEKKPNREIVVMKEPDPTLLEKKEPARQQKDSRYYHKRGFDWILKNDSDMAIMDFDRAIQLDPTIAQYYSDRGLAWEIKKNYGLAIQDYDEAIRLSPRNAGVFFSRGNAWFQRKNYIKAIEDYDEAIHIDPAYASAFANRGNVSYEKKDFGLAILDYDEAIRLGPENALFYAVRGDAWLNLKNYDAAIRDYDAAIRLNPKNAFLYSVRGSAWYAKKNYEKASKDFNEANRIDPKRFPRIGTDSGLGTTEHRVETFKDNLRRGLTPEQARKFSDVADKTETYLPGEFIADFDFRVPNLGAAVARFLPFEVPGVVAPRYRVNLLFVQQGNGMLHLETWYFRSPN